MKYKAVVFDFDGVLVESLEAKDGAFHELFLPYGKTVADQALAYHRSHRGMSRFPKFRFIHENFVGREPSDELMNRLSQDYSNLVEDQVVNCGAVPGAEETLKQLSPTVPIYVASATPVDELVRIVERRGWSTYFKRVHGYPVSKADALRETIAHNKLGTQDVLMVGDALADFEAAKTVGTAFIGRTTPDAPPFPAEVRLVDDMHGLLKILFQ